MWSEFAMPSRRHFLKHVAGLSALALPGIGFMQSLRAAAPDLKKKHKSLIILWMGGGPSTIDLWDLKPGSPNAGQFKPIKTSRFRHRNLRAPADRRQADEDTWRSSARWRRPKATTTAARR